MTKTKILSISLAALIALAPAAGFAGEESTSLTMGDTDGVMAVGKVPFRGGSKSNRMSLYGGDGRTTFGLPDLRGRVPFKGVAAPRQEFVDKILLQTEDFNASRSNLSK